MPGFPCFLPTTVYFGWSGYGERKAWLAGGNTAHFARSVNEKPNPPPAKFEPPRQSGNLLIRNAPCWVCRGPAFLRNRSTTSKTTNKFSPEVRARAVRMVTENEAEHPSGCCFLDRGQDQLLGTYAQ
jgi:hypothetical protein